MAFKGLRNAFKATPLQPDLLRTAGIAGLYPKDLRFYLRRDIDCFFLKMQEMKHNIANSR